jgi:hypothetical protein
VKLCSRWSSPRCGSSEQKEGPAYWHGTFNRKVLFLTLFFLCGCGSPILRVEYNPLFTDISSNAVEEVQVKIVKGLSQAQEPGSVGQAFVIKTALEQGTIPGKPNSKFVEIKFKHGLVDHFLVGRTNLTLVFNQDGQLIRVKDLPTIKPNQ